MRGLTEVLPPNQVPAGLEREAPCLNVSASEARLLICAKATACWCQPWTKNVLRTILNRRNHHHLFEYLVGGRQCAKHFACVTSFIP